MSNTETASTPHGETIATRLYRAIKRVLAQEGVGNIGYRSDEGFRYEGTKIPSEWEYVMEAENLMETLIEACPTHIRNNFNWDKSVISFWIQDHRLFIQEYGLSMTEIQNMLDLAQHRSQVVDRSLTEELQQILNSKRDTLPEIRNRVIRETQNAARDLGFRIHLGNHKDVYILCPAEGPEPRKEYFHTRDPVLCPEHGEECPEESIRCPSHLNCQCPECQ